ncbi:hypothetical protein EB796_020403 [Bugula neritina]|uniref:CCHC-type domain-containing protein n=1 Tax=Bugula neritina TaxID=10212 RepID=A0A7J7J6L0_BUGNE|nr:hypothetical protein EB796_020403 [Bugula neritina]
MLAAEKNSKPEEVQVATLLTILELRDMSCSERSICRRRTKRRLLKSKALSVDTLLRKSKKNLRGTHQPRKCPAYDKQCNNSGRKGHYAKVCLSKKESTATNKPKVHEVTAEDPDVVYTLHNAATNQKSGM